MAGINFFILRRVFDVITSIFTEDKPEFSLIVKSTNPSVCNIGIWNSTKSLEELQKLCLQAIRSKKELTQGNYCLAIPITDGPTIKGVVGVCFKNNCSREKRSHYQQHIITNLKSLGYNKI